MTKTRTKVKQAIKSLDQFGVAPTLLFKKEEKNSSLLGAIFSIVIKMFMLVEFIIQWNVMVNN